jgi:hypothetical protein
MTALLVLAFGWSTLANSTEAQITAEIIPSSDKVEITKQGVVQLQKLTLPIHRSAGIRYFSAGVGLDEREAKYPPFALKLIFVEGSRAFTRRVEVVITNEDGSVRVDIPAENVDGPWVFVDLPSGSYDITAIKKGMTRTRTSVDLSEGKTRDIHLRWPG